MPDRMAETAAGCHQPFDEQPVLLTDRFHTRTAHYFPARSTAVNIPRRLTGYHPVATIVYRTPSAQPECQNTPPSAVEDLLTTGEPRNRRYSPGIGDNDVTTTPAEHQPPPQHR